MWCTNKALPGAVERLAIAVKKKPVAGGIGLLKAWASFKNPLGLG